MSNDGIVQIHGKDYMTVAKRVELAHERDFSKLDTEVLSHNPVVIKATIYFKDGNSFTGISSVPLNSVKQIEKNNPYEVAETSAVGRALGFAGYGIIEGIASADEMAKGGNAVASNQSQVKSYCEQHEVEMIYVDKNGRDIWYHRNTEGEFCNGKGYKKAA